MKTYTITEDTRNAMLKELELEKFKTPDQFAVTEEQKKAQRDAVDSMHRRFIYVVLSHLDK